MKHFAPGGKSRLWKCVTLRVFNVWNNGKTTRKFRAKPGHGYSEEAIEKMLEETANDLERRLPQHEYSLVQVGPAAFNFVWRREREAPAGQEPGKA
ncbi:MAG: hypothetical protein LAN84_00325 [Acidobacteriia bacterium]|nr:hypothetical protein [Terriglobia bacterium]